MDAPRGTMPKTASAHVRAARQPPHVTQLAAANPGPVSMRQGITKAKQGQAAVELHCDNQHIFPKHELRAVQNALDRQCDVATTATIIAIVDWVLSEARNGCDTTEALQSLAEVLQASAAPQAVQPALGMTAPAA